MKPIHREEILGLAEYEKIRAPFRSRVIAEKKLRRVPLGPKASALFENRDTILLQIQEMLRTERITRPAAIQHEIDTYNENLPGDNELSMTLMIEIPDKFERDAFLEAAVGLERHVWLVAGGERIRARSLRHEDESANRTTAVHYLKFDLTPGFVASLSAGAANSSALPNLELQVDHPAYAVRMLLPNDTVAQLAEDLRN